MAKIKPFLILLLCLLSLSVKATELSHDGYTTWLQNLEEEAISNGISAGTVHASLDNVILDDRVVALDQKQPETTVTFDSYSKRIVSDERIADGRQNLTQYAPLLQDISARYGVPPQIIVALWGIESKFGSFVGKYEIVDSLTSLAYEGRRADFFRGELMNALRILDQSHMPASRLRGSWAGAMGQCQFMPSTYLHYAVDYNGDGVADIWTNTGDVFASIANYLSAEGWRPGFGWGFEVKLSQPVDEQNIGLTQKKYLSEWTSIGITTINDEALPAKEVQASLIQPDGADGRSFLVYDNYRAIMRWNRSTYFATSVGLLADEMAQ